MKRTKKMLAALMMALVMLMTTVASNALVAKAATTDIDSAKSSLVMVELAYEDAAGTLWPIQSGTGFLIDDEYVLTCYHVVNMTDEIKQEATDTIGVDFVNTVPSGLKVYIVVRRDMVIEASVVNGSEAADFSILKLSQSLNNRTYLEIGDSDNIYESQTVYALGYPSISDKFIDAAIYTSDDVTVTNGVLSKKTEQEDIPLLQHTATLSAGNSGGPLLNEDGAVIGINYELTYSSYTDEDGVQITTYTYRAVAINEVVEYLKALGIPYVSAGSGNTDDDETTIEAEATTSEEATTTEEVTTTEEQTTTEEPVTTTADDADDEESSDNTILIIAIVAGVIVLVLIVIIIIVVVSGNKKKAARKKAAEEAMKRQQRPQQGGYVNGPGTFQHAGQQPPQHPQQGGYGPAPQPQRQVYTQNNATPNYGGAPADGAGETSVLNSGAGETTVLGSSAVATLRRVKDGQSIQITKQVFLIGKERRKVDFCISDNNSISRVHAQIVSKPDGFYVIDQNSTNFTYVNGKRINPNQEVKLNNGDKIKFADEEFEFRL